MSEVKRPNSRANLDKAIERAFGRGDAALRARTVLADVVVAQMLPEGVVKGGSSLKMRYGGSATRFTRDLDTARTSNLEDFLEKLEANLENRAGRFPRLFSYGPPASYVPLAHIS